MRPACQALRERLERKSGPAAATRRTVAPRSEQQPPTTAAHVKTAESKSDADADGQSQATAQAQILALTSGEESELLLGAHAAQAAMRAACANGAKTAAQQLAFVQRVHVRAQELQSALEQRLRGAAELRVQVRSPGGVLRD